jgi:hypothetical protein
VEHRAAGLRDSEFHIAHAAIIGIRYEIQVKSSQESLMAARSAEFLRIPFSWSVDFGWDDWANAEAAATTPRTVKLIILLVIYLVTAAIVAYLGTLWLLLGWGTLIVVFAVALLWWLGLRIGG